MITNYYESTTWKLKIEKYLKVPTVKATIAMCAFVADVDECQDPAINTCEQMCNNVLGSFTCGCNPGYIVNPQDDTTCDGE